MVGAGLSMLGTTGLDRSRNILMKQRTGPQGNAPLLEPWPSRGGGWPQDLSRGMGCTPSYSGMTGPNILEEGGFLTICLGFPL